VDTVASRLDGSTVEVERVVVDGQPAKTICLLAPDAASISPLSVTAA